MTIPTPMDQVTREASYNGWTLTKDLGWSLTFERGELEKISVYFSEDWKGTGKRHVTGGSGLYPTGDVFIASGTPVVQSWSLGRSDKGKFGRILAYFAAVRTVPASTNATLAKFGFAPVLPTQTEEVSA